MNERLFISTRESYVPPYEVSNANYIAKNGFQVQLGTNDPTFGKSKFIGFIDCSTEEEAQWFTKVIFATLNNKKDLVIDFLKQSVYTLNVKDEKITDDLPIEIIEDQTTIGQLQL